MFTTKFIVDKKLKLERGVKVISLFAVSIKIDFIH